MQTGGASLRSLREQAAGFMAWWAEELVDLVPEGARRQFVRGRPDIVLAQVDDGFLVLKDASGASRARQAGDAAALPLTQALAQLARLARSKADKAVGIRLPIDLCFARTIELPAAARNDLRQILGMDLERATPFKHRDVYTAHVVEGQAATKGKLRVRQLVAKREAVDPLVAEVRAAGLDVAFVDCWSDQPAIGMPIDFLEPRDGADQVKVRSRYAARGLLVLVLLLILSAFGLTLWQYEGALAELRRQTAQARTQAASVRAVVERSDVAVAGLARLQDLKLKRVPAIEVLEEVSRVLPDTVWLNELRMEGDVLDLSGLAASGAGLPTLLGRSAILTDAALTAPVTLDQREDKERFSARARVKHLPVVHQSSAAEKQN